MKKITRALISVSDKSGIAEFAAGLAALGVEIISTGGTAKLLREQGLKVRDVSEVTGFPEMLDGRVKTLHPGVHGGILAMRGNPDHVRQAASHGIQLIDLVAVNLYPFQKTAARADASLADLIENIDIGGPSMIRAAAKNFEDVTVVVDARDYPAVLEELRSQDGQISRPTRARLSRKAFAITAGYDAAIAATLEQREAAGFPPRLHLNFRKAMDLRYGENPHQKAALYQDAGELWGIAGARQLQGKELSFNNLVDLDAAWQLAAEFPEPVTAIIKHTNPCGIATAASLAESYRQALSVDPVSAFGSVIAFNRKVDGATAAEVAKLFVEAIAAPGYESEALDVLAAKKNLRVMEVAATPSGADPAGRLQLKSITGGLLAQTADAASSQPVEWKCVTARQPRDAELRSLVFAWRVVKHVKSNAIVFGREDRVVGVGAGQMSRVDAVRLAATKARDLGHSLEGTVVASDAFFPFADGLEEAAAAGATAVVEPGGSMRDQEVIDAANRRGLAMMFTGIRHFRH
ncbi:MAG: bifunctional phosphoribosylaminoimidazolecarboxamide formyltransferase/IMP cyclohydrolase [Terriglobia bacterium]